eukprot:c20626_g1_i4.p2 GENE.c20626_g1_i4~~c20626_g1_i4.p2  ORF type:complete len:112 (+),score=19.05 c20626_g1_i4:365-700(+)
MAERNCCPLSCSCSSLNELVSRPELASSIIPSKVGALVNEEIIKASCGVVVETNLLLRLIMDQQPTSKSRAFHHKMEGTPFCFVVCLICVLRCVASFGFFLFVCVLSQLSF